MMKKHKNIRISLYSSFLAMFLTMLFSACDKDSNSDVKEEPRKGDSVIADLMGKKWLLKKYDTSILSEETFTLFFTDEENGLDHTTSKFYDTGGKSENIDGFTYHVDESNVIHIWYGINHYFDLTYCGNYLLTQGGDVYEALPITLADKEILSKYAATSGEIGNLKYEYEPRYRSLKISGNGDMLDLTAGKQPWKELAIEWVIIEEGVTSIGAYAFYGMSTIKEVDINSGVRKIGAYAFSRTDITQIILRNSVVELSEGAFAECLSLKELYLSDNLEIIGKNAFMNCAYTPKYYSDTKGYSRFYLPDNVKIIRDGAFMVNKIGELVINDKLEEIGSNVFNKVTGKLVIPNSVRSIGEMAFVNSTISSITIGTGLQKLGKAAFGQGTNNGKMYINKAKPLEVNGSLFLADDAEKYYTLYVPKGCKPSYQQKAPWNKFKMIIEDDNLQAAD